MNKNIGTQLFIRLKSVEKKRKFKAKCAKYGFEMKEVMEMAVDEFLRKGVGCEFIKAK